MRNYDVFVRRMRSVQQRKEQSVKNVIKIRNQPKKIIRMKNKMEEHNFFCVEIERIEGI